MDPLDLAEIVLNLKRLSQKHLYVCIHSGVRPIRIQARTDTMAGTITGVRPVTARPVVTTPQTPVATPQTTGATAATPRAVTPGPMQNLRIIQGTGGSIQVQGLLPGKRNTPNVTLFHAIFNNVIP